MRTPPPVLPPNAPHGRRRTLADRLGPEGSTELRLRATAVMTFLVATPIIASASRFRPATASHPQLTGVVGGLLSAGFMYFMTSRMPAAAGAGALAITLPDGTSTPYADQFSQVESLVARGKVAEALAAYEQIIARQPDAVTPRARAAELYAGSGANPARAAALFQQIRDLPGAGRRDALYASSRLVDLYDGVLDQPGRALVEMRRIIEQHPASDIAARARQALPAMKARVAPAVGEP